jgi:hypothetical protein
MLREGMPSYHPMYIYFIRRSGGGMSSDPHRDDALKVERLGENNLRISYTERTLDGTLVDISIMTYQKFFHYIQRIFLMLSIDDDPFHSVQIMVPGYPSSLMTVGALNANMYTILDTIITTCWQWPAISRGAAAPLRSIETPSAQ